MIREGQPNIAEGFVGFLADWHAHKFLHREVFGFLLFAGPEEFADLGQEFGRTGMLIFVRFAGPESVLVELEMFVRDASEDHRAEPAIADGKSVCPFFGGLFVPEGKGGVRGACSYGEEEQEAGVKERLYA